MTRMPIYQRRTESNAIHVCTWVSGWPRCVWAQLHHQLAIGTSRRVNMQRACVGHGHAASQQSPGNNPPPLAVRAPQADQLSDELLDSFQGGSMTLEQLVEQYSTKREAFHVMDIKRQAAEHHMFSA